MTKAEIEIPQKLARIFEPDRGSVQYRGLYGGRGSGKSYTAAIVAAIWGYKEPLRILCAREFEVTIAESFHRELRLAIESRPWLAQAYDIGRDYLRGKNGTEFIFRGLRRNEQGIKSLAGIDLTIVEEAEDVPEVSWLALEATVFRRPQSELWAIWNPRIDGSPVDMRFRKKPPPDALIERVNWYDNPFFPEGLQKLRAREETRLDPATYAHVWEGEYLQNSDSQVFAGKYRIDTFEPGPDWQGPYQGLDFGFAVDPTAAVQAWVHDDCLWIRHEAGRTGLELDETAAFMSARIPGILDHTLRADSARPESISYLRRHGMPKVTAVDKWPGSVADGIGFMRSFRAIIVHPDCRETSRELRTYSYKTDRSTGDVLPTIIDADNHYIDAIRYAIAPLVKRKSSPNVRVL